MDDKYKQMTFSDFMIVNPTGTDDELLAIKAQKRRRGVVGEESENKRVLERAMSKRKK